MRNATHTLAVLLTLLFSIGCSNRDTVSTEDFSVALYSPRHADGFEIAGDEHGNSLIRVTKPWQGEGDMPEQTLMILCDGMQPPADYAGQTITSAAERIVCMSSSHVAMLDATDCTNTIVGVSGKQYISNPQVAANDSVADIGYDPNLDFERLVTLHPDIVLLYGVAGESTSTTAKLRELKIPYLYIGDYAEQTPLGKAEWLVAVAEIAGRREQAVEVFDGIECRYEALRDSVAGIVSERPRIMLNTPYQDVWYMPSDDSYMVKLIEDAAGEYIYIGNNPNGGSKAIGLEQAYMLVADADIWLNTGMYTSLDELRTLMPKFAGTRPMREGRIYNNNRRRTPSGGSDFWESAIVRPDIVLQDLVKIMHASGDDDNLYYYQRLK
ncbi:MAG: ABC transporter substrate-binding protein [Alistipes sp.]|nr:ABC transporter substrate-binding protein [Alistipes sp.]MDE7129631.1 ABC transporter substrate-binding protein [Alistipes sp.]